METRPKDLGGRELTGPGSAWPEKGKVCPSLGRDPECWGPGPHRTFAQTIPTAQQSLPSTHPSTLPDNLHSAYQHWKAERGDPSTQPSQRRGGQEGWQEGWPGSVAAVQPYLPGPPPISHRGPQSPAPPAPLPAGLLSTYCVPGDADAEGS